MFRRLLQVLRPFASLVTLAVGLMFLTVLSNIGLMGTSGYLISRAALRPSSILLLMVPIVGVRFFGIARAASRYVERLQSHDVTLRALSALRLLAFGRLEPQPPEVLGAYHHGDLLSRVVHDVERLQDFYLRGLLPPLALVLSAGLLTLVVALVAPPLAWIAPLGLLVAGLAPMALRRQGDRRRAGQVLNARSQLSSWLADGITGVGEILGYSAAERYVARAATLQRTLAAAQLALRRAAAAGEALLTLTGHLATVLLLWLAIPLVRSGQLPGWDLAALALATLAAFEAAVPMPAASQALGEGMEAARRIFSLPQPPSEEISEDGPRPAGNGLTARGLEVRYPGSERPALQDLDLDLRPGCHVAVVGPSGAGKTSLLHALLRFAPITGGSVQLGGVEIGRIPRDELWRHFAVVEQRPVLFSASLRDNLRMGRPEASDEEIAAAVRMAQLGPLLASLPHGLQEPLGDQGLRLSGGERQRVALGRAIVQQPPIVLLDEPAAGLDATTKARLWREIAPWLEGRSLLLVTHHLTGLGEMDEILVVLHGRVVERGREEDLLRRDGFYREMRRLQADSL